MYKILVLIFGVKTNMYAKFH